MKFKKKDKKKKEVAELDTNQPSIMDRIKKVESESTDVALKEFESNQEGLTTDEAKLRIEKYGPNAIIEKKRKPIIKFLLRFWGPIPWMIEIAAIISGIVQNWADFSIILAMLLINALIGFLEEHSADNAIELLKKKLEVQAHVKRDGKWVVLPAKDLVPGDIVHIKYGELVPADVKMISGTDLELDQSALTGESLPVDKELGKVAFMSSTVRRGDSEVVVVGTGANTYFGETAKLVDKAKMESHYQKSIMKIGKYLIISSLSLVVLIFIVSLFRHTSFIDTLQFCLILTVAAIPVALPAVLSVTLAVGAVKLAKMQAIVSRLVSIEEMASMDVLCSDKTGTLTQNKMTLGKSKLFEKIDEKDLIFYGALSSRIQDEDPIEKAIFDKLQGGLDSTKEWKMDKWTPFDPVSKRTEAVYHKDNKEIKVSKGAPQAILKLTGNDPEISKKMEEIVEDLGKKGYRTLGVAKTDNNGKWIYLGILSLFDPPRPDSAETVEAARKHGIMVKMITGDHLAIAKEIAGQLSIGQNIVVAENIFSKGGIYENTSLADVDGFAQVYPEHKYNIVERLKKEGYYVGMTGDGVNDAPALKNADVGIAVEGATDAARAAADLVLTSPGLSVIISGVEESRRIFQRMMSYATYRIAETIRIMLFMTLSILVFDFYPVTTIMIIILAILNDGPIMMIAYDNTDTPEEPVRWRMDKVMIIASTLGVLGVIASFSLFYIGEHIMHLDRSVIQTLMFLKLTVAGHMTIYLTRSTNRSFWKRPLPAGRLFFISEGTQIVATLFAVYGVGMTPLKWGLAGLVWGYALIWFFISNFVKIWLYNLMDEIISKREQKHIDLVNKRLHAMHAHRTLKK